MFLRTVLFAKSLNVNQESIQGAWKRIPLINETIKRHAGHSQWANRKSARESTQNKRSQVIRKLTLDINKEVRFSKNANLAVNNKLKAIFAEGQRHSIPQSILDKALKIAAATLGHDSDCIHVFCFNHTLGITCLVEIASKHYQVAQINAKAAMKKFGFSLDITNEKYRTVGIITCKPVQTENAFDKAFEDAVIANCEEVNEVDEYLEFQCQPVHLEQCSKKLTELGYTIDNSEKRHIFSEYIELDDAVKDKLNKLESKLQSISGFLQCYYNTELKE